MLTINFKHSYYLPTSCKYLPWQFIWRPKLLFLPKYITNTYFTLELFIIFDKTFFWQKIIFINIRSQDKSLFISFLFSSFFVHFYFEFVGHCNFSHKNGDLMWWIPFIGQHSIWNKKLQLKTNAIWLTQKINPKHQWLPKWLTQKYL